MSREGHKPFFVVNLPLYTGRLPHEVNWFAAVNDPCCSIMYLSVVRQLIATLSGQVTCSLEKLYLSRTLKILSHGSFCMCAKSGKWLYVAEMLFINIEQQLTERNKL